jgi:hypothetical protein
MVLPSNDKCENLSGQLKFRLSASISTTGAGVGLRFERNVSSHHSQDWKIGPPESPLTPFGDSIEGRNSLVNRYKMR